jgi:N-acetylglutamate synthase-like GNAT family acetyltransferase
MTRASGITLRTADASEAVTLHAMITASVTEGHLLPRTLPELTDHAGRFVIALRGRRIVGCAELAPLSARVAEVRSLAVDEAARHSGVGTLLIEELARRARREGFDQLCAFTHVPGYFSQKGFSIVPHLWIPEKVSTDCVTCPHFQRCGQYAMVLPVHAGVSGSEEHGVGVVDSCGEADFAVAASVGRRA